MTEYERFLKELRSLLDGVPVVELDQQCVSFLAGESKLGTSHKELASMFLRDVQEIVKVVLIGLEKDGGRLTNQLEPIARVEHVTPRYESLHPLLAEGISSAKEIADIPDEVFVETFKTSSKPNDTESRVLMLFKLWLNWRTRRSAP